MRETYSYVYGQKPTEREERNESKRDRAGEEVCVWGGGGDYFSIIMLSSFTRQRQSNVKTYVKLACVFGYFL